MIYLFSISAKIQFFKYCFPVNQAIYQKEKKKKKKF